MACAALMVDKLCSAAVCSKWPSGDEKAQHEMVRLSRAASGNMRAY